MWKQRRKKVKDLLFVGHTVFLLRERERETETERERRKEWVKKGTTRKESKNLTPIPTRMIWEFKEVFLRVFFCLFVSGLEVSNLNSQLFQ